MTGFGAGLLRGVFSAATLGGDLRMLRSGEGWLTTAEAGFEAVEVTALLSTASLAAAFLLSSLTRSFGLEAVAAEAAAAGGGLGEGGVTVTSGGVDSKVGGLSAAAAALASG